MTRKIHDTDYLFLTTSVRALEGCLLNRGQMEQMLEAGSPEEAARILTDCGYPELETVSAITVGEMLNRERERLFQDLAELVPDPAILAVFQLPHDYHNVKVLLKSEAMGIQEDRLLVDAGRIPSKQLVAALRSGEVQNLPPQLGEAIDEARQVLSATRDPQLGDMVLDRRYFQELLVLAEETGSLFLQGYVQRMIDAANLRTAVRVLRMGQGTEFLEGILFPGGNMEVERLLTGINGGSMLEELYASSPLARAAESGAMAARGGSLTQFEKDCDDAVLDEVRRAQFVAFGEAPVIAYLAAKEAEILAIRIILTGRLADLAPDIIRERLREAYV